MRYSCGFSGSPGKPNASVAWLRPTSTREPGTGTLSGTIGKRRPGHPTDVILQFLGGKGRGDRGLRGNDDCRQRFAVADQRKLACLVSLPATARNAMAESEGSANMVLLRHAGFCVDV